MNSEPIETVQPVELPSKAEVIKMLAREKHRIQAVYDDQTGEQVHLGGRNPGEVLGDGFEFYVGQPIRCRICDAPSGQVTLMKVEAKNPAVVELAKAAGIETEGYVCFGGNCLKQQHSALNRLINGKGFRVAAVRRTASGRSMQWTPKGEFSYELTSREVARRKSNRKQQAQSRRANRAK